MNHLAHGDADAKAGHREVVASEAQQRKPDQHGKGGRGQRRQRQGEDERPVGFGDQHAAGVGADPEEGDVAEGGVPRQAPDQVPGRRHDNEHRGIGRDPEPELVRQEREAR